MCRCRQTGLIQMRWLRRLGIEELASAGWRVEVERGPIITRVARFTCLETPGMPTTRQLSRRIALGVSARATMSSMETVSAQLQLPAVLAEILAATDDPDLWVQVLRAVADDASELPDNHTRMYAIIGSCSHWLRPHQSRWTAAGGFALPTGYGDGAGLMIGQLPNLDWKVTLQFEFNEAQWFSPQNTPTKRFRSVRIAVPSRTARHRQAAIHAVWSAGTLDPKDKRTVFYAFRKVEAGWRLVARREQGEGLRKRQKASVVER